MALPTTKVLDIRRRKIIRDHGLAFRIYPGLAWLSQQACVIDVYVIIPNVEWRDEVALSTHAHGRTFSRRMHIWFAGAHPPGKTAAIGNPSAHQVQRRLESEY